MRRIYYISSTSVLSEPYTHRLVGNILSGAALRNYSIRLKVPDSLDSLKNSLLFTLINNANTNDKDIDTQLIVTKSIPDLNPDSIIFYAGSLDYWRLICTNIHVLKKCKKIYWYQGFESEESYLKHQSFLRRSILRLSEFYAMKASDVIITPSDAMIDVLLQRYPALKVNNFVTIPNLADSYSTRPRDPRLWGFEKAPQLALGYIGSLARWQCFEESCRIVAAIQDHLPDTWFLVLTQDSQKAESIIKQEGIRLYRILTATTGMVSSYASSFDLGFMLRKNHIVNYVSCPMKWLEYWQCGVPIIATKAVKISSEAAAYSHNCIIDIDNNQETIHKILQFASKPYHEREADRTKLIDCVANKWTWKNATQAIDDVFKLLVNPGNSKILYWSDRLCLNT